MDWKRTKYNKWELKNQLNLDILYCPYCGHDINCGHFGEHYKKHWKYCPYCGAQVVGESCDKVFNRREVYVIQFKYHRDSCESIVDICNTKEIAENSLLGYLDYLCYDADKYGSTEELLDMMERANHIRDFMLPLDDMTIGSSKSALGMTISVTDFNDRIIKEIPNEWVEKGYFKSPSDSKLSFEEED